jgi:hypothetical protein
VERVARRSCTGFWHETYFARGHIEAIYLELTAHPLEPGAFAPCKAAGKSIFLASAARRGRTAASSAVGETGPRPPDVPARRSQARLSHPYVRADGGRISRGRDHRRFAPHLLLIKAPVASGAQGTEATNPRSQSR